MYIYVCLQIIIFRWPVQIRHWTQTDFPAVPRCCIQKWHYLGYFPNSTDLPELLTYSSVEKMSLVMKKKSTNKFSLILSRSVQPNSADSPGLPRWGWRCFPLWLRHFCWKQSCLLWGLQSFCQQYIHYSSAKPSGNIDTNELLIWN